MANSTTYMDFETYLREGEPSQRERAANWSIATGLQAVDGLKVSNYLRQTALDHVEGKLTHDQVEQRITAYYQTEEARQEAEGTDEADMVSTRIARLLEEKAFTFSPSYYAAIHRKIFSGILPHAGTYRDYNISKREWVLDNDSVIYGSANFIDDTLRYDFSEEAKYKYRGKTIDQVISHIASFVSGIWQIHPFREGNTRTTAIFTIKYLRQLGYHIDNEPFAQHSWYFRNALVRANYHNVEKSIDPTTEYLELFFRNILLNEHNELKNRYLHIRWRKDSQQQTNAQVTMQVTMQDTALGINTLEDNRTKSTMQVTMQVKQLVALMEDRPYSRQELMRLIRLKNSDHFRLHYLQPALQAGLIEMTIPDKPTSRLQQYRKTHQ